MKATPASRTPRRFRMVMTTRIPTQRATVCGCSEEAGEGAQVVARDGIGAAAGWIGSDRLSIRKVDDDQQRNDGCADGNDVLHAEQAEWNQQAESGFRAVSSGTERIQAEDGYAFADADLLGAFFAGLDGLADNGIEDVHSWSGPEKRSLSESPFVTRCGGKSTAGEEA